MTALANLGWWEQIEMFPQASETERKVAKAALSRYRRMRAIVEDFELKDVRSLAPKQQAVYNAYKNNVEMIDRAVRLITDDDVRRMIDVRYIKGQPHHVTIARFEQLWHPSTVDRKINKGIESVANTLKLWES